MARPRDCALRRLRFSRKALARRACAADFSGFGWGSGKGAKSVWIGAHVSTAARPGGQAACRKSATACLPEPTACGKPFVTPAPGALAQRFCGMLP